MEKALYEDWTTAKAVNATTPSGNITSDDYGTKTINGIKVYYMTYTDSVTWADDSVHEIVKGNVFFKKNGEWQHITWTDPKGNPNKAMIDKEIADKINNI
jgi:phage-related protein